MWVDFHTVTQSGRVKHPELVESEGFDSNHLGMTHPKCTAKHSPQSEVLVDAIIKDGELHPNIGQSEKPIVDLLAMYECVGGAADTGVSDSTSPRLGPRTKE